MMMLNMPPDENSDAASTEPPQRTQPRVLVIDDDPQISQAIKFRLETYGIEVVRAFDGMPGFWTALETRPDVIVCDLVMPDGEGNYLLSRFRSHTFTKDVPIIILTGQTNPALKRQMLSLGVSAYLTKPLVFDELLAELRLTLPGAANLAAPTRQVPRFELPLRSS
ncbi:MAG TPA: response regulator [Pirellulales bacterium]|jgi:DNA-binding response OmpR family regulator|nr:response regulator [Pirellulales bacterium]